ncbi:MAG TPA: hypothetical protein VKY85_27950 [Candidatus Angelobacter sp.]|nr:hypothetical protein [Candidatus Angelobacter sp.]
MNRYDPISAIENILLFGFAVLVLITLCVFFILRFRWWLDHRRFRPTYHALGNAFQELQSKAVPQIRYVLEKQREEKVDEDDDGGPDDPKGRRTVN